MPRSLAATLALLAIGLAVLTPPAEGADQRVPSFEAAVVVDSTGTVLGPLLGVLDGLGIVLLQAGGRAAQLMVGRDQLASFEPTLFESTNCTGAPLMGVPSSPPPWVVERAAIGPLGEILVPTGNPQSVVIRSYLRTLLAPGCEPSSGMSPETVRPTVTLPVSYVPPLRVQSGP